MSTDLELAVMDDDGFGCAVSSDPAARYESALKRASAIYRREWLHAQLLPTFAEASAASYAADRKRCVAWQQALAQYREEAVR